MRPSGCGMRRDREFRTYAAPLRSAQAVLSDPAGRLVEARTDPVGRHENAMQDGVMTMRPVWAPGIPAGGMAELAPGGG